jgi:hypothetical protein
VDRKATVISVTVSQRKEISRRGKGGRNVTLDIGRSVLYLCPPLRRIKDII